MNLDSFTGPGSTPSRRRFWDKVTQAVNASQKVAGKNVSVDEHQGYGSLISVNPQRAKPPSGGTVACCFNDITCSDLSPDDCIAAGGTPRGTGTSCADHGDNGCCTDCSVPGAFGPGCTDGDGNCWTGPENCDGTCQGTEIPCITKFLIFKEYCLDCPDSTTTLCAITTYDPVTCEATTTCISNDCCDSCADSGTTQSVADPYLTPC